MGLPGAVKQAPSSRHGSDYGALSLCVLCGGVGDHWGWGWGDKQPVKDDRRLERRCVNLHPKK